MRIIAGRNRGTRLADVGAGDAAAHLRPTPDRVRESLFSLLESRADPALAGALVLDLFAGTGALGLEALSRGAERAVFVDTGLVARGLLRDNIARTHNQGRARVWRRDATDPGPHRGAPFTLVFLDPPYGTDLGLAALTAVRAGGWLAPGALIAWEDDRPHPPPPGFAPCETRRWGATHVTLLTVQPPEPA